MIIIAFLLIVLYFFFTGFVLKNTYQGKPLYMLLYIVCFLPFSVMAQTFVPSSLMNVAENTASAKSRINDADYSIESANLAKAQVLQQAGTAMLSQANARSQLVLQLPQ